jgi:hypothetical protein
MLEDATMRKIIATLLLIAPLAAGAQTAGSSADSASQPPIPQPEMVPPPPPDVTPGPPITEPAQPQQAPAPLVQQAPVPPPSPSGQWVYTSQYGWIWMPYGEAYTYAPAGGAAPDMYVYYPAFGWTWVVAPWVWGLGPRPYFGVYGWTRFAWYGRGFGRWYGFGPRYLGWGARGYWAGGRWIAPHAAYPHVAPNFAYPHGAPHYGAPHYAAPHYAAPHASGRSFGGHAAFHGWHR